MTAPIRVGTVSWAKDDWAGTFYPTGLPAGERLAHYAKTFDTVEVDATFYRTPTRAMCKAWREQTPPEFRFSLKVMKRITHDKLLEECEEEIGRFMAAASELGDKFGFAVLQFGKFGKKSRCPDLGSFLRRLEAFGRLCADRSKFVVEIRNPEWVTEELLGFLREQKFVFAMTEVDGMPKPAEVWERFGRKLATSTSAYARIFGERKKMEEVAKTYERILVDRTQETKTWCAIFKELAAAGTPVWAYFSNYFAGHAPGSALICKQML